ncbi:MAG: hypothetical protein ABW360_01095 [Phenylobacterium sp.]
MFMFEANDSSDRDEAMLAELAELDLALARRVHAFAMAAEDPEQVGALARGYQRVARSLRQTLALKAKLTSDRAADRRANPPPAPRYDAARAARRQDELRVAMRRVIWKEAEDERADWLFDLLEDRLADHGRRADFGVRPLDEHVLDLCADFSLTLEGGAGWRDLPDPEEDPGFEDYLEAAAERQVEAEQDDGSDLLETIRSRRSSA